MVIIPLLNSINQLTQTKLDKTLTFQLLKRVGEWSQVPENSQLLFDIKYRLIFIYQYHKDFYHLEEDYLTVHFLKIQPFTRILKHFNINVEKVKLLLGVDRQRCQRELWDHKF